MIKNLATICLALAFVFTGTGGALAQFFSPVANAGPDQTVASGATVTLDGRGSTPGTGATIDFYYWRSNSNNPVCAVPPPLIEPNSAQPSFSAPILEAGVADVIYCFSLQIEDTEEDGSDWDEVRVTVTSPIAAPVADAGDDLTVEPGDVVRLDGSGSTGDHRAKLSYAWARTGGTTGASFRLGDPTAAQPSFTAYAVAAGAADVTHIFTLRVTDNKGSAAATDTVTITVTAPPDTVGPIGVFESPPVSHDGMTPFTITIVFDEEARFIGRHLEPGLVNVSETGHIPSLSNHRKDPNDRRRYTFTVTPRGPGDIRIGLRSGYTDWFGNQGGGLAVEIPYVVPIEPPVADAGEDQTVASGATVTLDGRGSTPGTGATIAFYDWKSNPVCAVPPPLIEPNSAQPSFTAPILEAGVADVIYCFSLQIEDTEEDGSDWDEVRVTVTSPIAAPVADAGDDLTVEPGDVVRLDGSGSTGDHRAKLSYSWARTGGTAGASFRLSDLTAAQPSFTAYAVAADADGRKHVFTLTVTDDQGSAAATDTVTVTVTNAPPIANAGLDQTVASGSRVTLDGSGSWDPDGTIVSYLWMRTGGNGDSGAALSNANATQPKPSFAADTLATGAQNVTHVFSLVVTDNDGAQSVADTVRVTVTSPFAALVAEAGDDQEALSGATVTLDGSGSTGDPRATLSYSWARSGGTTGGSVDLTAANTATPTFTADTLTAGAGDVTHIFTLRVTDNKGSAAATDTVTITVIAPPDTVGPIGVFESPPVSHDGMTPFTITIVFDEEARFIRRHLEPGLVNVSETGQPTRHIPLLSNHRKDPNDRRRYTFTVTPRGPGDIRIGLRSGYTDWFGNQGGRISTPVIPYVKPIKAPVANAGPDQTVDPEDIVTLDGSGSTGDPRATLSYSWERSGGTTGASVDITAANTATPTFTADTLTAGAADVTHIFTLTVTDDQGSASATDVVTVTVEANAAPTASAGPNQDVGSGATVQLDGSRSRDTDGTIASYLWRRVNGYGSSGVTLFGADTAKPSFTADTLVPGTVVNHVFELVVTDDEGAQSADTVTVYVIANAPPIADAGPNQTVASGATVQLDGSRSWDPDGTIEQYYWNLYSVSVDIVNYFGSIYDIDFVNNRSSARQSFTAPTLAPGAADVLYVFWMNVADNTDVGTSLGDKVTVTVKAPNVPLSERPIVDAGPNQIVATGATVQLDGSRSWDRDGTIASYLWTRTGGVGDSGVTLIDADTAKPSFTADTDRSAASYSISDATHVFSLVVTNDKGVSSEVDEVEILVSPNLAPVAKAGPDQTVASGAKVTLDGSGSSHEDRFIVSYLWTRTGGSGDSTVALNGVNTARPSFTPDTLAPGAADVTHVFSLVVWDNHYNGVSSEADEVTITVESLIKAPVAEAGDDQEVAPGDTVRLDGSGSTEDRRATLSYAWERTGGTTGASVALSDPSAEQPTFTADSLAAGADDVTHEFTLTVTDNKGSPTSTATVTVTVKAPPPIYKPIADAGPDKNADSGARVTLDGRGSDDRDGTVASYRWKRKGGSGDSGVTLINKFTAQPSFTADSLRRGAADVTHIFSLVVTDNDDLESPPDEVTITVKSPNAAPIANAGPDQIVESGTRVTLDGRGSIDIDGDIVSYLWTRTGGSENSGATLTNTNTVQPSFVADTVATGAQNVTHFFSLVVMDDEGVRSTANQVTITVEPTNLAPVAVAGPRQIVASGATVQLDGRGSYDEDGTIESYRWRRSGGTPGRNVALSDPTAEQPTFATDTLESGASNVLHYFLLVVTDNDGTQSIADTVEVEVTSQNIAPIADAGPNQVVASGATVQLDGSRSLDRDGTIVSYYWSHSHSSGIPTLKNRRTARASFTADTLETGARYDVTYTIRLYVTDNGGKTSSSTTIVTIKTPNRPPIPTRPIADAGPEQTVASGATVQLDGSRSLDRNGTIVSYYWSYGRATDSGVFPTLKNRRTARASFTAPTLEPGAPDVTLYYRLVVTDNDGEKSVGDDVRVHVIANNALPVAEAGPNQTVASGATVQLDGSGSWDSDGTIEHYYWHMRYARNPTLTDAITARPSFTAETLPPGAADVTYYIYLFATDNGGKYQSDTVTVTVTAPNIVPVAVAGDDQEVASGETVYLDGNGSSDQDGHIEKYLWERVDGTSSRINVFEPLDEFPTNSVRGKESRVSFTADTLSSGAADVTHVFNLWVADNDGAWSVADQVTVTITPETTALASYADPGTDRLSAGGDVDILVSPSELTVQEGGPGSYRVKLSESPGQNVIVTAASSNEDVVLENPHLSFNADNWNEWQQVTLRAVADSDNANDVAQIRHSIDANAVTVGQPGVVSITVRDEDIILRPIGEYLETRATTLLRNQPKLIHFLKLNGTTPDGNNTLSLNATDDNLNLDGAFVRDGMWGAITGSYASNSSGDLNYALGSFGIHWKSSEHLLAGAMLQFDLADGDLGGRSGSIDGKGWLAGPYFAARHVTQPLFFEGRMLYGQSNQDFKFNDDVFGERNGSFSTTRWLAQLRMEGEIALSTPWSDGSRLIPYADARWTEDSAAAFTDSIGIRVPGQKVSIGEFELGSNIEVPISMAHGSMTFTGGLGVVFSNTDGDYIRSESRSRGRGEVGFSYSLDDNVQIDFEGYFDGIGTSQYESYGLSLSAVMKF